MASLNKVQLIGNLGRNPEVRNTQSGKPIATLSIATSERCTDKETGELKEATEWRRVVLHGRNAELAGENLVTGSQVYAEGALSTTQVERCTERGAPYDRSARLRALVSRRQAQGQRRGQRRARDGTVASREGRREAYLYPRGEGARYRRGDQPGS
jgi:single-strand DNA-binding protein